LPGEGNEVIVSKIRIIEWRGHGVVHPENLIVGQQAIFGQCAGQSTKTVEQGNGEQLNGIVADLIIWKLGR
jgi:hypothetical protein